MAKNHVFTDTRIQTKRDTSANWESNNPILLNGEEILVDTNAGEVRKKVGDGTKTYTQLPFIDEPIRTLISNKVDKIAGKGLSTNDYTTTEKEKLAAIEENANNYVHPKYTAVESSGLYKITVDNTGHVNKTTLVTKSDITSLGIPAQDTTYNIATTSANGLMSFEDKSKLDGIAAGAEVNQNAFSNIKVGSNILVADAKTDTFEFVNGNNVTITAADDKITINAKDTTYSNATTTVSGLMSSTDKSKLDGIAEGANNYVHPSSHPATMIAQDETHRFVTDTQISSWNAKADDVATHIANTSNPHSVTKTQVGLSNVTNDAQVKRSEMGTVGGVATLDTIGRIPTSQMPTTVNSHLSNTSNPHSVTKTQVGLSNVTNDAQVKRSEMGVSNGVATLDTTGRIPSSQLPSYVDDVIEGYYSNSKFYEESALTTEITGESGKIYVDLSTNKTYRWSGTAFVVISDTIALGETSSTAYAGDKGKANADAIVTIQTKLSGIEEGANKYVHPSTHPATMIVEDATHRFVTDTEKSTWNAKASTAVATTTTNGLMSASDKTALEDIKTRLAQVEAKLQTAIFYG